MSSAEDRPANCRKPKNTVQTLFDNGRCTTHLISYLTFSVGRRKRRIVGLADGLAMGSAWHGRSKEDNPVVLVIDDDRDVREGLRALLDSVNLQSRVFGSGHEFLRSEIPDQVRCLILDVRLPGLSGLDFQTEVQIDIPIIFVTGHGDIPMSVKA